MIEIKLTLKPKPQLLMQIEVKIDLFKVNAAILPGVQKTTGPSVRPSVKCKWLTRGSI